MAILPKKTPVVSRKQDPRRIEVDLRAAVRGPKSVFGANEWVEAEDTDGSFARFYRNKQTGFLQRAAFNPVDGVWETEG